MKKLAFLCAATTALMTAPASADQLNGFYVGAQAGYHDIGASIGGNDVAGVIYGAYAGINRRLAGNLVVGAEGNFNLGSNDIDSEYGLNANLGIALQGSSMVFLRGGYQWTDFDLVNISEDALGRPLSPAEITLLDAADDTDSGFLFGGGVQFGLGENLSVRAVVDTIEFDTVRATGGVAIHF